MNLVLPENSLREDSCSAQGLELGKEASAQQLTPTQIPIFFSF